MMRPAVFAHVTIRTAHEEASRRFFDTVLSHLGHGPAEVNPGFLSWGELRLASAGEPAAATTRLHVGFAAPSLEAMRAFWQAGVDAGFASDGEPGPRPEYGTEYHGAFLLDPDGNSIEAVVHGTLREPGRIDHLWIRVADRAASRRFYDGIAAHAGFEQVADLPDRTRYSPGPGQGSFSVVDGVPTSPFGLGFEVGDADAVAGLHAAATRSGAAEAWSPRREGHRVSAAAIDPDGTTVEAVREPA